MRITTLFCLILIILISGCSGNDANSKISKSIFYDFKEPFKFPFEVNEVYTEVAIDNPDYLHQFVFHYKSNQSMQEIRYILSKVLEQPEKVPIQGTQALKLENGKTAYYQEDETSQSLWWEGEDGFLARIVYYINGNKDVLGDYKLDKSELIKLANQVQ